MLTYNYKVESLYVTELRGYGSSERKGDVFNLRGAGHGEDLGGSPKASSILEPGQIKLRSSSSISENSGVPWSFSWRSPFKARRTLAWEPAEDGKN